jgi:hypothetical protein
MNKCIQKKKDFWMFYINGMKVVKILIEIIEEL